MRRRERRVTNREIDDLLKQTERLTIKVTNLQDMLLEQRRYIYKILMILLDRQLDEIIEEVGHPPEPTYDRNEYTEEELKD